MADTEIVSSVKGDCALDNRTGLLWELKSSMPSLQYSQNTYSWYQSGAVNSRDTGTKNGGVCVGSQCDTSAYVAALNAINLCGRNNWRLPNRDELRSIVDYEKTYPGPTTDQTIYPGTLNQFYWSATPSAMDSDSAWGIGFAFGYDYTYSKSHAAPVRLVSNATNTKRYASKRYFSDDASMVIDTTSNLLWRRCSEGQTWRRNQCHGKAAQFSWVQAQQYVSKNVGWRLPTLKELAGLVELANAYPAINPLQFPNTPSQHYWTSTRFVSGQAMHWQVQFATGDSHNTKDSQPGALRLVNDSHQLSVHRSLETESPANAQ